MPLSIIFEDNHLLAVAKPAGMLVQGDASGDPTLLEAARRYLKDKYAKPGNVYLGLVHRLDRNVSGVVLLGRTSKAAGRLSAQFRDGAPKKTYLAVCAGPLPGAEGDLESWLAANGDRRGVTRAASTPFAGARCGRLCYRVLAEQGGWMLVQIELITGRRHQIRAQMALAGSPLLGDVKYGSARRLPDHRLALHAQRLEVAHPVGGHDVVLEAPLPADWPWPDPEAKASPA